MPSRIELTRVTRDEVGGHPAPDLAGGITFHSLRNTLGTHMAASPGVTLVALKEWMGRADTATTMIYLK